MDDDKPELHLLPGDHIFNVDAIAAFFEKLTGRKLTPDEVEEARAYLEQRAP